MKSCSSDADDRGRQEGEDDAEDEARAPGSGGSVAGDAEQSPEIDHRRWRGWRRAGSAPRRPGPGCRSRGGWPSSRRCAVEETGRNSVTPSMTPRIRASKNDLEVHERSPRSNRIAVAAASGFYTPHRPVVASRSQALQYLSAYANSPSPAASAVAPRPPDVGGVWRGGRPRRRASLGARRALLELNPAGSVPVLVDDDRGRDRRRAVIGGTARDARRRLARPR